MVAAHKAGRLYWRRNRPEATDISIVPRSLGYREENETAWLAGFFGEKLREENKGRLAHWSDPQ